jgi:nucleoside-diphosphate-sugar epimerase
MNLLVTGASGFLGRNLLAQAPPGCRITAVFNRDKGFIDFVSSLRNGGNIVPVQCDLTDRAHVGAMFDFVGSEWDCCLHLAATVDIPWSVREPRQDLMWNAGVLLNVLEFIRADRFIYFSSGAVYDGLNGEARPDARLSPTLPYAIAKLACERYVEFHRQRRGNIARSLIVRFFGAYGPYEAAHKVYTRLVQTFAIEGSDTYGLYGDGQNLIDAMYVDDAVEAVRRMIEGKHWNHTINLAAGSPMTIESLVTRAGAALGVPFPKICKQGVANEHNDFWGSTAEMRELYGFEAKTPIEEGIVRFRDFLVAKHTVAKRMGC